MRKFLSLLFAMFVVAFGVQAQQMFTTSPAPLQNSSKNVVITFHADLSGVSGLKNLAEGTSLYAHIGASTNKKPGDWAYTPTTWNKNYDWNEFKYVGPNTYELSIPDLRSYFNIKDESEVITKIAVIARKASASNSSTDQTKDVFIEVAPDGFAMQFVHDQPSTIITAPKAFNFTVSSTLEAELTISVNGQKIASATSTSLTKTYGCSSTGSYRIVATATRGGETLSKTIYVLYTTGSPQANYPGGVPKMGPVVNADGSVTFCIAAPNKNFAVIYGSWDDYATTANSVMSYQDYNGYRYFWKTISGLDPNTDYIYGFNIDGTINVGDPYARLALDPYNDKWLSKEVFPARPDYPYSIFDDNRLLSVHRSNFAPYTWKHKKDFKIPEHDQLIVYEMLLRDFTGTEGAAAGNGTILKAIDKIPYLVSLGVNAVELMPIMEFNGNTSWGYNTNFYFALDKAYGSPQDLKRFVDVCHANGIAVILDAVFNHSDGLHPWYQMYPTASNPFYNSRCPHDWGVLNDFKQENPLVQQQWKDVIQYWMSEYDVDGYRFDLVKGLGTSYGSTDGYNASRIPVMKELHKAITAAKPNGIHINEFLGDYNEELEYCKDGQIGWNNQSGNSIAWAKGYNNPSSLNYFSAVNCSRPWGTVISYAESHDEQRVAYEAKTNGSTAMKNNETLRMQNLGSLAAQLLMTPGPQMIWQFGEFGDEQNNKTSSGNNVDNKKVNWNYLNDENRRGLHDSYQSLIWIRRNNPELFTQNAGSVSFSGGSTRSAQFVSGNKEVVVLINVNATQSADVSFTPQKMSTSNYQLLSSSHGITAPTLRANGNTLVTNLPPRCYAVFGTKSVTGVDEIVADEINIDAPVEWYNIQGQRISEPANGGIYIRRQGANVSKIIVR